LDSKALGTFLVTIGIVAVVLGASIYFGWLSFIGRLPGDIRIETENTKIYIPLASMLLLSVFLTLVLNLLRRLF